MYRKSIPLLIILLFLVPGIFGCNAPTGKASAPSKFTEQDLLNTVEAMPTYPPTSADLLATRSPQRNDAGGIWPTMIPTVDQNAYHYETQAGDTMAAILLRFSVESEHIQFERSASQNGYLTPGNLLIIERRLGQTSSAQRLLPDAELVYSSTASDFDLTTFVQQAGGYLSRYREVIEGEELELAGAAIVQRVASELSVNPRLLLALLDYRSDWVYDHPLGAERNRYPLGFRIPDREGLFEELKIAATQLNLAYYGWRTGSYTALKFDDGTTLRLDPTLNAGSVALMHLFAILSDIGSWEGHLYAADGFPVRNANLFGDPWRRAQALGPIIPGGLVQAELELPFLPNEGWSLTAGPHYAWNTGTPLGALDFSPIIASDECEDSPAWVTASVNAMVVRARDNVVALDLDGDGDEGSGWVIVYYHIAEHDMIPQGADLAVDQRIGHPSCEGGTASGIHVHVARKYNGEWLPADGPAPFVISGWRAVAGQRIYQGELVKGDQVVTADPAGRAGSTIFRE